MKTVGIIQARMSSSRLPGKVLLDLAGKPVLGHIVERMNYCRTLSELVVATSDDQTDDPIEEFCSKNGLPCYRGDLNDVLSRFYFAAEKYEADNILRITGDCPVIDPVLVDCVVMGFLAGGYDLYGLGGEFPDGLDCTVYSSDALKQAFTKAILPSDREHVGTFIEKDTESFHNGALEVFTGMGHHRWTLDEPEDYKFLIEIFDALYDTESPFLSYDILNLLKKKPSLLQINSHIERNAGYRSSLTQDPHKHE